VISVGTFRHVSRCLRVDTIACLHEVHNTGAPSPWGYKQQDLDTPWSIYNPFATHSVERASTSDSQAPQPPLALSSQPLKQSSQSTLTTRNMQACISWNWGRMHTALYITLGESSSSAQKGRSQDYPHIPGNRSIPAQWKETHQS
jgi:hypothetical protein